MVIIKEIIEQEADPHKLIALVLGWLGKSINFVLFIE